MTHATELAIVVQSATVEAVGTSHCVVLPQELIVPHAGVRRAPLGDDAHHPVERDDLVVLIDDDPIGFDEHPNPILEPVDPELRNDVEAEAPASRALPDVDAVLGTAEVPEVNGALVVDAATDAVVVRSQVNLLMTQSYHNRGGLAQAPENGCRSL